LSEISLNSIRHEFLNETTVRIFWLEQLFSLEVRLKNLETNSYKYPNEINRKSALFIDLPQASIYQLEFTISKRNFPSLNQITNYLIQTGQFLH